MVDAMSTLLGSAQTRPSRLNDLIIKRPNDITLGLFSGYTSQAPSGNPLQKTALQGLKNYVQENLIGIDAKKIMAQITAVEGLFALNDPGAQQNVAYAILAGNAEALRTMPAGSMVNRLF